jgi:D-amino-acid oxidase
VAVVGAGVSGLTTAVVFAENGFDVSVFADKTGQQTTSAAAAAIWFPYDAEPADKVIPWALTTYRMLVDLARNPASGVSMIELRQFSRSTEIEIPNWAGALGNVATDLNREQADSYNFKSGFAIRVPLTDTTVYLKYLRERLTRASACVRGGIRLRKLEEIDQKFKIVINCAGFPKIKGLNFAIVCDDAPLMYAIPRKNDCVFGGTNEISDDRTVNPATTSQIVDECCRVLNIDQPKVKAEKVGLRPFRKSGVRLEAGRLSDGRTVIHNYGHGGAGFTLSWGCAREALKLVSA